MYHDPAGVPVHTESEAPSIIFQETSNGIVAPLSVTVRITVLAK
jgi:hypothetical protein